MFRKIQILMIVTIFLCCAGLMACHSRPEAISGTEGDGTTPDAVEPSGSDGTTEPGGSGPGGTAEPGGGISPGDFWLAPGSMQVIEKKKPWWSITLPAPEEEEPGLISAIVGFIKNPIHAVPVIPGNQSGGQAGGVESGGQGYATPPPDGNDYPEEPYDPDMGMDKEQGAPPQPNDIPGSEYSEYPSGDEWDDFMDQVGEYPEATSQETQAQQNDGEQAFIESHDNDDDVDVGPESDQEEEQAFIASHDNDDSVDAGSEGGGETPESSEPSSGEQDIEDHVGKGDLPTDPGSASDGYAEKAGSAEDLAGAAGENASGQQNSGPAVGSGNVGEDGVWHQGTGPAVGSGTVGEEGTGPAVGSGTVGEDGVWHPSSGLTAAHADTKAGESTEATCKNGTACGVKTYKK
jgi:hypothetical protein